MRLNKFCLFLKRNLCGAKWNTSNSGKSGTITDTVDPTLIFDSAEIFQRCAIIVWDASRSEGMTHLARGYVVLAALSSEQYLKCLLRIEDSKWIPLKHSPKLLFNHLKTKTRKELRELHDQQVEEMPNSFSSFEKLHGTKPTLDELLDIAEDAFEKFRYAYQYPDPENV